LIGDYIIKDK